jgi:hypothetical protein
LAVRWFSDSHGLNFISENNVSMPIGNYPQWLLGGQAITAPTNAKSAEIVFQAVNGTGDMYADSFEMLQTESVSPIPAKLFNYLSIALIIYIISYYILKRIFMYEVEKPQKIFTMGIGIYFITWIVFLILFYTLIVGLS